MGGKTTALKLVCPKSGLRANHGSAWLYRANIKIQDFSFVFVKYAVYAMYCLFGRNLLKYQFIYLCVWAQFCHSNYPGYSFLAQPSTFNRVGVHSEEQS